MKSEDAQRFAHARLHERRAKQGIAGWLSRPLFRKRVTRRFAMALKPGTTETIERVDPSVVVRCASGELWVIQDGDCKDVVLGAQQTWRAQREGGRLHLQAVQPCVVEIEFEDDAPPPVAAPKVG